MSFSFHPEAEKEFDAARDFYDEREFGLGEDFLVEARAFHTESLVYDADFIAYGLPATFRADLSSLADAFEASFSNTASANAEHVAATADTSAKVREGMVIVRILDGIVKNKYANDPGKLAAWISASHVEKAPKKKEPTP